MASFGGFQAHDFDTDVSGTHWRHRQALAADLRRRLRCIFGQRYQSWGQPGVNLLHIARRAVYTFPSHRPQPCLFVQAGPQHLWWGLSLPAGDDLAWAGLLARLDTGGEALSQLLYLLRVYALTLTDRSGATGGALGGCWRYEGDELMWQEACSLSRPALPPDIPFRLADSAGMSELSLYAAATPDTAIGWGAQAAERLLPVLIALVPLYERCVALGRA
ncbi:MAG: hypothetical protein HUU23_14585 [Caldilineales bacterium]|nr:hypothetical protein [Caldilineales bacterium]